MGNAIMLNTQSRIIYERKIKYDIDTAMDLYITFDHPYTKYLVSLEPDDEQEFNSAFEERVSSTQYWFHYLLAKYPSAHYNIDSLHKSGYTNCGKTMIRPNTFYQYGTTDLNNNLTSAGVSFNPGVLGNAMANVTYNLTIYDLT